MTIKLKGTPYILWRAVDAHGNEIDVFIQKRRNKKSAIRFLTRLLGKNIAPRVIITDKLRSYIKPIRYLTPNTEHRSHKGLNNRAENAHQPTRRKEKYIIKFKSPQGVQRVLSLMGKVRNIFSVAVGRYSKKSDDRREQFRDAIAIWNEAASQLTHA